MNVIIPHNVLQLCETANTSVLVKPFCITVVSFCKINPLIKILKE
jgi:hypothetical protein